MSRFQQLLSALFIAAACLVLTNAWLAFHAEEVLADSERGVTHTLEVTTDLERVLYSVAQAESAVRGYMLTDNPRYLLPYDAAMTRLPDQLGMLGRLAATRPEEVAGFGQISQVAREKTDLLQRMLRLRQTHDVAGEKALRASGRGEDLMSALRDHVETTQQAQRVLLGKRLNESAAARSEAKFTVALASTLDILFVVFSLWSLNYERGLRRRAAEFSSRLEKLQSITEVAFTRLTAAELTSALLTRLRSAAATDALVLCRRHGDEVELLAAEGMVIAPGERYPIETGEALAECVSSMQPVRLTGPHLERLPFTTLQTSIGSALVLPMTINANVMGMLVAGRERGTTFSTDDEELLVLAADRIALALDRAAAYDAERAARRAAEASSMEILELNAALEERVQLRTAELENINRELEAFSYSVSHDLRAPLRTVDGFSVALEEDYGHLLEGEGQHYLSRIRAGVQRMGQLIDALLQLSRITRAEFSSEMVDLSSLAKNVAEEVSLAIPDRTVNFSIEPDLQAPCDYRLLRVVFENMFGNAAKFTGKTKRAEIAFGWSPEQQAYYVRDNGAGFDQKYAGKLFVAFQRLHGDKDFQGSGIGLATVARVIRRHHGTIRAEGEVARGATFWFTLGDSYEE